MIKSRVPLSVACHVLDTLGLNKYITNFVGFKFDRNYIIIETDATKCFCLADYKRHFLAHVPLHLKNTAGQDGQFPS